MYQLVNCLAPFLERQAYLVLDGGLASELEHLGMDLNDPLWSAKVLLEQPDAIAAVHRAYLEAGADLITSASYQASYPGLANRGLEDAAIGQLLRDSVYLAKTVRNEYLQSIEQDSERIRPLVAASVGPYGAFLADGSEYTGQYGVSRQTLYDFHRPRLAQLVAAEPDILAIETIPCLEEAEVLLALLAEFPQQPALLSYSCRDGKHISSGEPFKEAVKLVLGCSQILAVGINCTAPQWIGSLLEEVCDEVKIPLLVYPNRGEAWDPNKKCWIPGSAGVSLADQVATWYSLGAQLIGGCCRVRPVDITAIRTALAPIQP